MKNLSPALLISLLGLTACGSAGTGASAPWSAVERTQADSLLRTFDAWYTYAYNQVPLGRPFVGLDTLGQPLARAAFLKQLLIGRVVALRVSRPTRTYRLYPLASPLPAITAASQQLAATELSHYALEGKPLPAFDFRDLQGKSYTPTSTRGKVLVLKTWYTSCLACVDEFPQVNALAAKYRANPDVVFVSLALNDAPALREFLRQHEFAYAVVSGSKPYIANSLHLQAYPTHLVVGKDGRVVKVVDRVPDLALALASVAPLPGREAALASRPETGGHP